MIKLKTITILLFMLMGMHVFSQDKNIVIAYGKFKVEWGNLDNTKIKLYRDGKLIDTYTPAKNGKFEFELVLNYDYMFWFEKPEYVTKKVNFNTTVPAGITDDPEFIPFQDFDFYVTLFKSYPEVDTMFFQNPVGKIMYDAGRNDFDWDKDYTLEILKRMEEIEKQLKEKHEQAEKEKKEKEQEMYEKDKQADLADKEKKRIAEQEKEFAERQRKEEAKKLKEQEELAEKIRKDKEQMKKEQEELAEKERKKQEDFAERKRKEDEQRKKEAEEQAEKERKRKEEFTELQRKEAEQRKKEEDEIAAKKQEQKEQYEAQRRKELEAQQKLIKEQEEQALALKMKLEEEKKAKADEYLKKQNLADIPQGINTTTQVEPVQIVPKQEVSANANSYTSKTPTKSEVNKKTVGSKTVTKTTLRQGNVVLVYVKIEYPWGGPFFFIQDETNAYRNISEIYYNKMITTSKKYIID